MIFKKAHLLGNNISIIKWYIQIKFAYAFKNKDSIEYYKAERVEDLAMENK